MGEDKLKAIVAKELAFDATSVRDAFGMQISRQHSGKVVVKIASEA
jgi:hypothetical protein